MRKYLKCCGWLIISLILLQFAIVQFKYRRDILSASVKNLNLIDENDKVSWENVSFIEYEAGRVGPGEQGKPFNLSELTDEEMKLNEELNRKEGFYVIVSDKISVNRALPDKRPEACKVKKYLRKLPKVSVIVTFHNEIWSVLMRCIHSIYNRSPRELLHEILLINDASTFNELRIPLEKYISTNFEGKVKVHHNEKREGLIRARMIGAKLAEAEVIVFLDSHMEVGVTWLPPILEPLVYHPTFAVVPIVEGMNHMTFEYTYIGHGYRGTFDWNFRYQWLPLREFDTPYLGNNYELSSMTGENYELSLKLWLCSGGILCVPCSRIVHLSKVHTAYRVSDTGIDFSAFNLKRVAEVWLDDYKQYFYRGDPERYAKINAGDLSKQFELKKSLNCKPFKYFLDVVAPEMLERFPIVPRMFAALAVENLGTKMCLGLNVSQYHIPIILADCPTDLTQPVHQSDFILTWEKSIKFNDTNDQCLDSAQLILINCHHQGYNQYWKFNLITRQIYNPHHQKCLSGKNNSNEMVLMVCNENDPYQKWRWGYENQTAIENWDTTGISSIY